MAATNEAEKKNRQDGSDPDEQGKRGDARTMGRKHIIPYGLYRAHGYVSAPLACDDRKGTGFTGEDLDLLFESLTEMFEHDRSAARGEMATRRLVVFRHASKLGSAHAQDLFARVETWRLWQGERYKPGDERLGNAPPARSFADYAITVARDDLPNGVEIFER